MQRKQSSELGEISTGISDYVICIDRDHFNILKVANERPNFLRCLSLLLLPFESSNVSCNITESRLKILTSQWVIYYKVWTMQITYGGKL